MLVVASAALLAYAFVNAFGAWVVIRRRSRVAMGFMAAATLLAVSAVAVAFSHPSGLALAAAGVVAASMTSLVHARVVLRRVVPLRHVLRAVAGLLVVVLAAFAQGAVG